MCDETSVHIDGDAGAGPVHRKIVSGKGKKSFTGGWEQPAGPLLEKDDTLKGNMKSRKLIFYLLGTRDKFSAHHVAERHQ